MSAPPRPASQSSTPAPLLRRPPDPPPAEIMLRCPGDGMRISHSIHLGRVASHYPPCAECEHRPAGVEAGSSAPRPANAGEVFTDEGIEGVVENQIHASLVRKLALAVGVELRFPAGAAKPADLTNPTDAAAADSDADDEAASTDEAAWTDSAAVLAPKGAVRPIAMPTIVLAADGRSDVAELLAAASEGLRRAGCGVMELEPMTAPGVAEAMLETDADGAFYIGNPAGASRRVGIQLWRRGARPLSAGGGLDDLRLRLAGDVVRPTRSSGPLARSAGVEARIERLRGLFHALRPLRFVLDTASRPLVAQLARLLAQTACRTIVPEWLSAAPGAGASEAPHSRREPGARSASPLAGPEIHRRRLASLSLLTMESGADFGLWIDGDGERLAVVDERGRPAPAERLLLALARPATSPSPHRGAESGSHRGAESAAAPPFPPIVIEEDFDSRGRVLLERHGFAALPAPARREPFFRAMADAGATLGGGPSGRLWFAPAPGEPAIPDALRALGHLLQMLSRGDAPLSEALDAAAAKR